ncbi:MAG: lysophospholipase [Candidatus Roseilinea sp.]|nr:MAG: lysophospholipase [Candidatus Roseilinea sp.]
MNTHILTTADGLTLNGYAVPTQGSARANVILVHGLGDHAGMAHYRDLAQWLAARGFNVQRFDLRGHGTSQGKRVFVNAWQDYRDDLRLCIEHVQRAQSDLPLFLVGLSMGALIVIDYVLRCPDGIRGVVTCSPPLGETGASKVLVSLLGFLSKVAPATLIDPGLDKNNITRDARALEGYLADPLMTLKVTPRLANALLSTAAYARTHAGELRAPLLLLHGADDAIANPAGTRAFYQAAGSQDKMLKLYPDTAHNLFLESVREQVFQDIADWMTARV